jgi:hypothetical protein
MTTLPLSTTTGTTTTESPISTPSPSGTTTGTTVILVETTQNATLTDNILSANWSVIWTDLLNSVLDFGVRLLIAVAVRKNVFYSHFSKVY